MGAIFMLNLLKKDGTAVYGVVAIEMIGYFSDEKGSQTYPIKVMKVAYGKRGDYILLVIKNGSGKFVKNFSSQFKKAKTIETKSIKAPAIIPGIDFLDHRNYWNLGYDALMVTNSAFYRNENNHQTTDKMETLDIGRMSKVIDAIYLAIINLDDKK